jgi:hypothetical protein
VNPTSLTSRLFDILQGQAFLDLGYEKHKQEDIKIKGDCCFNHIIGLPTK